MIAKCKLQDIGLGNVTEFQEFSDSTNMTSKAQARRTKTNKCNHQSKKLLHSKEDNKGEKVTYRMEENICKPHMWWKVNLQNTWELLRLLRYLPLTVMYCAFKHLLKGGLKQPYMNLKSSTDRTWNWKRPHKWQYCLIFCVSGWTK